MIKICDLHLSLKKVIFESNCSIISLLFFLRIYLCLRCTHEFIMHVHTHCLQHLFCSLSIIHFCVCDMLTFHEAYFNSVKQFAGSCGMCNIFFGHTLFLSLCASIYICCHFKHVIETHC